MKADASEPHCSPEFLHSGADAIRGVAGAVRLTKYEAVILLIGTVQALVVFLFFAVIGKDRNCPFGHNKPARFAALRLFHA